MQTTETEALVVRAIDYKEHHRILTMITGELGKVGVVAYGAKRSQKRFAGALQPFQLIRAVVKSRRGRELYELVEAEVVEPYRSIPTDPGRYACASWVLELLREITAESEADRRPLEVLVRFLRKLEADGASPSLLSAALLEALRLSGFAPALDRCAACGRAAPSGKAGHFEPSRGIVCSACGGSGPLLSARVRQGLIAAREWEIASTCTEAELAPALLMLCTFSHEQVGRELRSFSLLGRYLRGQIGQS